MPARHKVEQARAKTRHPVEVTKLLIEVLYKAVVSKLRKASRRSYLSARRTMTIRMSRRMSKVKPSGLMQSMRSSSTYRIRKWLSA